MFSKEAIALAPKVYEAIKKISKGKWEWEPDRGEWYFSSVGIIHLISEHPEVIEEYIETGIVSIPLLHWERIVKILETLGYDVTVTYEGGEELNKRGYCNIWKDGKYVVEDKRGKDCQEAVQRAVIQLAKDDAVDLHGR